MKRTQAQMKVELEDIKGKMTGMETKQTQMQVRQDHFQFFVASHADELITVIR